ELLAALDHEVLPELIAPVHLEHQAAEVADAGLARLQKEAPLAAELACVREGASNGHWLRSRGRRGLGGVLWLRVPTPPSADRGWAGHCPGSLPGRPAWTGGRRRGAG